MAQGDLNKQLGIQQQINKLLADRAKMIDTATSSLSAQTQVAVELCKALNCEDLAGIEDRLAGITDGLGAAAGAAGDYGEASQTATDQASEGGDKAGGAMSKLSEHLTAAKGAGIGAGVGIVSGLSGAVDQAKAAAAGIKAVSGALGGVGKSILMMPFKMMGALTSMAGAGGGGGPNPIKVALEEIRGEMGSLASNEGKALADGMDTLKDGMDDLGGTGVKLSAIYGKGKKGLADALKDLAASATAMGPVFGLLKDEFASSAGEILAFKKGLGITDDAMKALGQRALASGKSLTDTLHEQANLALQLGDKYGISAKKISKSMNEMTKDFSNFGSMSQKELGATAVYAAKLGMEVKDMMGVIDKFDNFETAAEGASQLAQSFGMNVDAMAMMNAQSPAERIDILRKSFAETGKSIEDMTRQERKLLESQTGLTGAALDAAFAQENMGLSYDDVLASADDAEKKPLSQAEAMDKLADSMQKVFGGGGGGGFSGFWDAFTKGFGKGIKKSKEFRKLMKNMRKSMKLVNKFGKDLGKMFVNLFPGIKDMLGGLADLFDPKKVKEMMGKMLGIFKDFFQDLQTDPKAGVEKLLDRLKDLFGQFFDSKSGAGAKVKEGFIKFIKAFGGIIAGLIPVAIKALTGMINKMAEAINNPQTKGIAQNSVFSAIMEALQNAFDGLMAALPGLVKALMNLFVAVLKNPKLRKVMLIITTALIAKVLLTSALSAAKGAIMGKISGVFAKFFGGTMDQAGNQMASNPGAGSMNKSLGEKTSMGKSLRTFFSEVGKIKPSDIIKAGIILMLLVVMMAGTMILFAYTIKEVANILKPVSFKNIAKAFFGLGVALLATWAMIQIAVMLQPALIFPAMLGMLAGALMLAVGGLVYAEALVVVMGAMGQIDGKTAAKAMGALALAAGATILLAIASALMVPLGVLGIAGIALAGIFLAAAAYGFVGYVGMVSKQMSKINVKDAVKNFLGLAVIALSIALVALPMALMGLVAVPAAIGALLSIGLLLALNYVIMPQILVFSKKWAGKIKWLELAKDFLFMAIAFAGLALAALPLAVMSMVAIPATIGLLLSWGFFALFPKIAPHILSTHAAMSTIEWKGLAKMMAEMAIVFVALAISSIALAKVAVFAIPAAIGLYLSSFFWDEMVDVLPTMTTAYEAGKNLPWTDMALMMAQFALVMLSLVIAGAAAAVGGLISVLGAVGLSWSESWWETLPEIFPLMTAAYEAGKSIPWTDMALMMAQFALVMLSVLVAAALAVPAGILGAIGSFFLGGVGSFMESLVEDVIPGMQDLLATSVDWKKAAQMSASLIIFFTAIAAAAAVSVLLAVFALPWVMWVAEAGFGVVAKFAEMIKSELVPAITALASIKIEDPGSFKLVMEALAAMFKGMVDIGEVGIALAEIDLEAVEEGAEAGGIIEGVTKFIQALMGGVTDMIYALADVVATLDPSQLEGLKIVGDLLPAIGNLVTALQPPPELFSLIEDTGAGWLDSGTDGEAQAKLMDDMSNMMKTMMDGIADTIPIILKSVLDAAATIKDPEAVKPKLEIVAMAIGVVAGFGTVVSQIAGQAMEMAEASASWYESADPAEGMKQMEGIIGVISGTMAKSLPTIIKGVIDAAKETDGIEGAEGKIKVVGQAMDIVSKFGKVIMDMKKMMDDVGTGGVFPAADMVFLFQMVKQITDILTNPEAGLGKIVTAVMSAADSVSAAGNAEEKLKLLGIAMKVIADFSKVLADVVKLAPGKADDTITTKMANIKQVLEGVVDVMLDGLDTVITKVVDLAKTMNFGSPEEVKHKLEMLSMAMKVMSDFSKAISDVAKLGEKGDPKTTADQVANVKEMIKGIVEAMTQKGAGFGEMITAVKTVAEGLPEGNFSKKLENLSKIMEIVGSFADTVSKVAGIVPKPSALSGVTDTVAAPDLWSIIGDVVGAVELYLPDLVRAITGTDVPTDRTFTKKLTNLGLIMDAVGKFADVLAKISGMGGPTGDVAGVLKKTMEAIVGVMKPEGGEKGLPDIIEAIGKEPLSAGNIKGNTRTIGKMKGFMDKFTEAYDVLKALPSNTLTEIQRITGYFGPDVGIIKLITAVGETAFPAGKLRANTRQIGRLATFATKYSESMTALSQATGGTVASAQSGFTDINRDIETMNSLIEDLPEANVKAAIRNFGTAVWKGDGISILHSKPIVVKINVDITMSKAKIAEALKGEFASAGG
jgi:hypothetical protein